MARLPSGHISLRELFRIFVRSGLEYGSGIGIAAYLQDEFAERRRSISRADFLSLYGIARLVPSGTVTALAIALGYRARRLRGATVAIVGMILPSFVMTVGLTIPYTILIGSEILDILDATLVPAAVAVLAVGAIRLGREFYRPSVELGILAIAFAAVLAGIDATGVLFGGGVAGALLIRHAIPVPVPDDDGDNA